MNDSKYNQNTISAQRPKSDKAIVFLIVGVFNGLILVKNSNEMIQMIELKIKEIKNGYCGEI